MTQIYDFQFAIADFQFMAKEIAEDDETKLRLWHKEKTVVEPGFPMLDI
jgi:hypothetical protein